jgi:molybdenum cofactor biosynthesis enzyme MoaA
MLSRIDRLAALGTLSIDLSGGEPLLHPDLDEIVSAHPLPLSCPTYFRDTLAGRE